MQIKKDRTARDMIGALHQTLDAASLERHDEWVMLLDDAGCVQTASAGSHRALRCVPGTDLVGAHWADFWPSDTRYALKEAVSRGFQGRITQYLAHREHKSGAVSHWQIRVSPVQDDAGKVVSVLAVSQNLAMH